MTEKIEVTPEMMNAGMLALLEEERAGFGSVGSKVAAVYRAMTLVHPVSCTLYKPARNKTQ